MEVGVQPWGKMGGRCPSVSVLTGDHQMDSTPQA